MTDEDTTDERSQDWKPCPECGERSMKRDGIFDINRDGFFADVVCTNCGNEEPSAEMYDTRSAGEIWDEKTPDSKRSSDLDLTPKQKLWQNSGSLLVVVGILLSLTIVGAIIGIPMIIAGMLISSKGGPDIDDIEFSCPECETELAHDTEVCPECGEDGLRLSKSRSLREPENSD